jgi:hypothetical protein
MTNRGNHVKIKNYILLAIAVVITAWLVYPDTTPNTPPPGMVLVQPWYFQDKISFVQADGRVSKAAIKERIHGGRRSIYCDGYVYSFCRFGSPNRSLCRMNICGKSKPEQIHGMETFPYDKHSWLQVLYVDQDAIYFSAYVVDKFRHQFKGRVVIYKLDRKRRVVRPLGLNYNGFGASVAQGHVYYTDPDLNVIVYHNGVETKTGLRGVEPSVSPDGKHLIFRGSTLFTYNQIIKLHNFETGKTKWVAWNMVAMFEKKTDWSPDSRYFSFKDASDISSPPLMIAEASTGKIVAKIEDRGRPFMITEDEYKKIMRECNYSLVQQSNID